MAQIHAIEALDGFTGEANFGCKLERNFNKVFRKVGSEASSQIEEEVETMGRNVEITDDEKADNDELHEITDDFTDYVENLVDEKEPKEMVNRQGVPKSMTSSWRI